jgi:hypothetical protein
MYEKNDKRRLYWLIDQYLSSKIDEDAFCNDFHDTLVNEMYYEGLTDIEHKVFSDLSDVSQRFSQHEEDLKLWAGFVTADQLKQKIHETKEKLKEQSQI